MVARALEAFASRGQRYGVFWDYPSLHQNPRKPAEDALFRLGLQSLGSFYAHAHTKVFLLTSFPAGYPEGYDLPSGANVAAYPGRGSPPPCPSRAL